MGMLAKLHCHVQSLRNLVKAKWIVLTLALDCRL